MDNLGILDLVIGLFFIYFVLSVICTAVVEGIAQFKDLRSGYLNQWIRDAFGENLGDSLLEHGLIKGLTPKSRKADYIPAHVFSAALIDLIYCKFRESKQVEGEDQISGTYDFDRLEAALLYYDNLLPVDMKHYLLQALEESKTSGGSLTLIKKRLEDWYGQAMERLTGAYKKRTRYMTWIVAILVTFATNADTVVLSKYLENNPEVSKQLADAAEKATKDSTLYQQNMEKLKVILSKMEGDTTVNQDSIVNVISKWKENQELANSLYKSLYNMGLPLGWKNAIPREDAVWDYVKWGCLKIIGLLITALALTLGAPFWFDTINKLVNIRSAGNKPASATNPKVNQTPAG